MIWPLVIQTSVIMCLIGYTISRSIVIGQKQSEIAELKKRDFALTKRVREKSVIIETAHANAKQARDTMYEFFKKQEAAEKERDAAIERARYYQSLFEEHFHA